MNEVLKYACQIDVEVQVSRFGWLFGLRVCSGGWFKGRVGFRLVKRD